MILNGLMAVSDALWGTPMIVVLVSMGLYLSIRFHFYYNFRHIGFHFRNTFGKMFQHHGSGQGSVSGFAAALYGHGQYDRRRQYRRRGDGHRFRRPRRRLLDVGLRLSRHVDEGLRNHFGPALPRQVF